MKHRNYIEQIDSWEDKLLTALGRDELLNNIILAMSYDEKKDIFEYIARCFDIDLEEGDEEEGDEEEEEMCVVKAKILSLEGEEQEVIILEKRAEDEYIVLYRGERYIAIYNPFDGKYYVDDMNYYQIQK